MKLKVFTLPSSRSSRSYQDDLSQLCKKLGFHLCGLGILMVDEG